MSRPFVQAHPVHATPVEPDRDNAWRDVTIVLFAIAVLLLIAGVATLFAKGYLR